MRRALLTLALACRCWPPASWPCRVAAGRRPTRTRSPGAASPPPRWTQPPLRPAPMPPIRRYPRHNPHQTRTPQQTGTPQQTPSRTTTPNQKPGLQKSSPPKPPPPPHPCSPNPRPRSPAKMMAAPGHGQAMAAAWPASARPAMAASNATARSDCQGECLARSRTCAPIRPLFGCNAVLMDNGAEVNLCID